MTGNPLSGHTNHNLAALSGTANAVDGLADGDHIVSPTLTNILEGVHGNGIILEEDTANGATNRSVPENLPGICEQVTNTYTFTVTGGHAVIDGLLYAFAGGPGSSADIDITSSSNHKTGSPSALTSGQEALVVVYVSSDGGDANNIYWELGSPVTAAANTYPSAPSSFLNFPNGSLTVKQSVVLAVLRVVFSSGGGNLKISITEINDKRAFVRPSPLYFTPVTTGAVGAVNAPVDLHTELDNLHGGSDEAGDFAASRLGALWQSHGDQIGSTTAADNQKDVLYYSGTHAARFTRSVFDRVLTSTATSITLKSTDANILLLTPGGSATVTTSGAFPAGYIIEVRNLHASNAVAFTRASSYSIAGGSLARFVCTTSHATTPVFSVLSHEAIVGTSAVITQSATGGGIAFKVDNDDTDQVAVCIDGANIDADVVDIIADAVTTAHVIDITADALTTGSVLNIVSNSASTATRNLVHIHNDHASASGTTALKVTNDHANSDGAGPPVAHLVHTGLGDTLRLEAINDTDSTAPDLIFKKTTSNGNAASGELIGNIDWLGVNAGNAEHRYANMYCRINSPTAGNEYGELKIETIVNGTTKERISFQGVNTVINADGANLDTIILDFAGGNLLFADAQRKSVGFGEQPPDINASLYSKLAVGLKETTAPTATADYGKVWTQTDNELYFQDGAGTNQVIQKGGKQTMWIPAAAMYPNTTAGCSALTQVELSNGPELKCLDFDDGATESAQFTVAFPKSWNEGTVTFKAYWCSTATDTDGVSWGLRACGMNDNETINLAFGTQIVVDDANQGAANELMVTAESSAITIAGTPAAEDLTFFQISRVHDDSNDTAAEDARLLGIKLYYTTDAGNDV